MRRPVTTHRYAGITAPSLQSKRQVSRPQGVVNGRCAWALFALLIAAMRGENLRRPASIDAARVRELKARGCVKLPALAARRADGFVVAFERVLISPVKNGPDLALGGGG